jgi:enoyl-CoA hydratase/carnithine racemase
MSQLDESPVVFSTIPCAGGMSAGVATLNAPKTLNGLTLDMTRLLATQLEHWATDSKVALVILKGAGDKAFCAGGDLHALHHSMLEYAGLAPTANVYAGTFFAEEYALDYRLHTFPKPVLVWGDGIVMGGGMGLMMGASHRVVTETSRLAMPEISIGLFPDVGGTWLLNRLPGKTGLFMGLTGAQVGAADALFAGLADYHIERGKWDALTQAIASASWVACAAGQQSNFRDDRNLALTRNHTKLHQLLAQSATQPTPLVGPLQTHQALIQRSCVSSSLDQVAVNLLALAAQEDPWLQRAAKTFASGSPGSARLTFALLERTKRMSLAQVFRTEWIAGLMAASHGDFAEGIRALLIDKDKQPNWNPATLQDASADWVEKFFTLPVPPFKHPLHTLGELS